MTLYLQIAIPRPLDRLFTYRCPEALSPRIRPGQRVRIPFGRQKTIGTIVGILKNPGDLQESEIREILEILDDEPAFSEEMLRLAGWLAGYYFAPLGIVLKTMLPAAGKKTVRRKKKGSTPPPDGEGALIDPESPPDLTPGQKTVLDEILPRIGQKVFTPYLLHGVTGSGKTEIYLQGVERARSLGLGSIVMVPEIALTSQAVHRFQRRFPGRVAVFHSGLSDGERREAWEAVHHGRADVVVGTRSAIFAPFPRLGLVVVDEEHDPSYKQEEGLRYNGRDLAVFRAKETGAVVLLGSATPSLESFYHSLHGKYGALALPDRVDHRPLPHVTVVDLRPGAEKPAPPHPGPLPASGERETGGKKGSERGRKTAIFSPLLEAALADRLQRGEQSLLFLNRRGYFPLLLCEDCGYTPECPNCSLSLTWHLKDQRLLCHACDYKIPMPETCPHCHGPRLNALGMGTERVEDEIRERFPEARVVRMDRDTTRRKASHERIWDQMRGREADILIGTQMITKGLDFPHLTLVGVILADTGIHLPDFRAAERTFQLLTQVAGRTGRGDRPGEVIVQTYNPEHPAIRFAANHDYEGFSREELALRKDLSFPPHRRLARLLLSANREESVSRAGEAMAKILRELGTPSEEILGPAPAPLEKLRGRIRWQILLKCRSTKRAGDLLRKGLDQFHRDQPALHGVRIDVDMDPQSLL